MAVKIREYWFGGLMALFVVLFLLFVAVVAAAPHNDAQMRGFTPCTYVMAEELNAGAGSKKMWQVISAVGHGYLCYAGVMREGVERWAAGSQPTPWANYMFAAETYLAKPGESEPLSEELLKANRLDDEEENETFLQNDEIKESIDE